MDRKLVTLYTIFLVWANLQEVVAEECVQVLLCESCPDPAVCEECVKRYTPVEGICTRCEDELCLKCDGNPAVCTLCPKPFILIDGKCIACTALGCLICSSDDPSVCQKCLQGYARETSESDCLTCNANCNKCKITNGEPSCQVCDDGYDVVNGACIANSSCETVGCAECQDSVCTKCARGYQPIQGNNTCHPCSPGCAKCNVGATKCLECEEGSTICTGVEPELAPFNPDDCINIHTFCEECSSLKKCTKCSEGYRLFTVGDKVKCKKCDARKCLKCDNGPCTKCKTGFRPGSSKCEKCEVKGCADCSFGLTMCNECKLGRRLSQNGLEDVCEHCDEFYCASCPKDASKCEECLKGETCAGVPSNTECKVPNCAECQSDDSSKCKTCNSNFKRNKKGKCRPKK